MSSVPAAAGPLVSIILTSYNYRHYIATAIDSALGQTYANLEVVLVDNCSTDGTVPFLRERYAGDPRLKIFENETNIGQVRNSIRGFELTTGTFVTWLSADDWLTPGMIERELAVFARSPEIDVVYAGSYFADEGGRVFAMRQEQARFPVAYVDAREELVDMFTINCPMCWGAALFRRDLFVEVGLEDPESRIGATDWELGIRMALAGKRFAYLPEPLMVTRVHDAMANASGVAAIARPIRDLLDILDLYAAHPQMDRLRGREGAVAAFIEAMLAQADAQGVPDAVDPELRERVARVAGELHVRAAAYEPARVREARISVVLPASRAPRLVARAIASVAQQTHANWEIVLVDHGPIALGDWLDMEPQRAQITYLRSPAPLSPGRARALGMRAAHGEYLAFLSEDNTFGADHLMSLVDTIERTGATVAAASARLLLESADPFFREIRAYGTRDVFRRPDDPPELTLVADALPLDALLVYRRVQDRGARFNEVAPILDDYAFVVAVARAEQLAFSGRPTLEVRAQVDFRSPLGANLAQYLPMLDAVYAAFPVPPPVQALRVRHRANVEAAIRTLATAKRITPDGAADVLTQLAGRALAASEVR